MEQQTENEITLYDIFNDVVKGWYIFLIAVFFAVAYSFLYINNEKNIYTISLNIFKIDDIKRFSLPDDLDGQDLFYFFHSSLKSEKKLSKLINEHKLFDNIDKNQRIEIIYNNLKINIGEISSQISFTTPDLRNINDQEYIDDVKKLINLLLLNQQNDSFKQLKKRYEDKLIIKDKEIKDAEEIFKLKNKIDNEIADLELDGDKRKIQLVYKDLVERLESNLKIAYDLNIKEPIDLSVTNNDSTTYVSVYSNEQDRFKTNLLSILNMNDIALFKYGSIILEKELELMQQKFESSLNTIVAFQYEMVQRDLNNARKFEQTDEYLEFYATISNIKRNVEQLKLLENSDFNFVNYDIDEIFVKSEKISIYFIFMISIFISLAVAFIFNVLFQSIRKRNN